MLKIIRPLIISFYLYLYRSSFSS